MTDTFNFTVLNKQKFGVQMVSINEIKYGIIQINMEKKK